MSIPISQFIPPPPPHFPPLVSIRLLSTWVSLFLLCKPVHLYHFSRFHIYALIHDICFSLSDLLHSVWQSIDPSTSLQMTQFRSFLWPSTIPLYIYTTSSSTLTLNSSDKIDKCRHCSSQSLSHHPHTWTHIQMQIASWGSNKGKNVVVSNSFYADFKRWYRVS